MPAVSNTSPLFNLASIDHLPLLREQFGQVFIPKAVLAELQPIRDQPAWVAIQQGIEENWISPRTAQDDRAVQALKLDIDSGEAEAIVLALELGLSTVLIDEREGRAAAVRLGLAPTGVLGVLLKAKQEGRILSVQQAIIALQEEARFRIHPTLFQKIVALAGEEEPRS